MNIRPIAIALIKHNGAIFVGEGYDSVKEAWFYRPLGGGIEFGEKGEQALKREFLEEMGAELADIEFLTVVENLFTLEGKPGHQIVLVYRAQFKDAAFTKRKDYECDEDGTSFIGKWVEVDEFISGKKKLVPESLCRLLFTENTKCENPLRIN